MAFTAAEGFRQPTAGLVDDRRWQQADETSTSVAQFSRADERAHPLELDGPHLCHGQCHDHRQRQPDTGFHVGEATM